MIIFRVKEPKLLIQKAKRPPWQRTRTPSRLTALSKAMNRAVKVGFVDGITTFKKRVNPEAVYDAWLSKDYGSIFSLIPWDELPGDLGDYGDAIGDMLEGSGEISMEALPAPVQEGLRWDMTNPEMRSYVDQRTGAMVQNITEDTQRTIASAVARSFDQAMTPGRVADMIRPSIGLGDRLGRAHANYTEGLRQGGLSDARIEKLSAAYERKLLDYRSTMIARTEISDAKNAGQLSVWKTAMQQGLIDPESSKKVWVVDGNPCPECLDLEDQGPIGIGEYWDGEDGPIARPPAHPNCECEMDMELKEPEEGAPAEEDEEAD